MWKNSALSHDRTDKEKENDEFYEDDENDCDIAETEEDRDNDDDDEDADDECEGTRFYKDRYFSLKLKCQRIQERNEAVLRRVSAVRKLVRRLHRQNRCLSARLSNHDRRWRETAQMTLDLTPDLTRYRHRKNARQQQEDSDGESVWHARSASVDAKSFASADLDIRPKPTVCLSLRQEADCAVTSSPSEGSAIPEAYEPPYSIILSDSTSRPFQLSSSTSSAMTSPSTLPLSCSMPPILTSTTVLSTSASLLSSDTGLTMSTSSNSTGLILESIPCSISLISSQPQVYSSPSTTDYVLTPSVSTISSPSKSISNLPHSVSSVPLSFLPLPDTAFSMSQDISTLLTNVSSLPQSNISSVQADPCSQPFFAASLPIAIVSSPSGVNYPSSSVSFPSSTLASMSPSISCHPFDNSSAPPIHSVPPTAASPHRIFHPPGTLPQIIAPLRTDI